MAWTLSTCNKNLFTAIDWNVEPATNIPEAVRNKVHNRFLDVLPNPRTRVVLDMLPGDPTSEYYNANFIRSFDGKNPKAFIASMGPLAGNVAHFWRMVWQEQVRVIVMVTQLEEAGKPKCERYFPVPHRKIKHGDITITWVSLEDKDYYQKTTLNIRNNAAGENYDLIHLWYTAWPDHGIPSKDGQPDPDGILDLLAELDTVKKAQSITTPILMHCSAGVGRTGCIIAIDHATRQLEACGRANTLAIVETLRKDRVALVQHANQYELLHQACLEFARRKSKTVTLSDALPADADLEEQKETPKAKDVEEPVYESVSARIARMSGNSSSNLSVATPAAKLSSRQASSSYIPGVTPGMDDTPAPAAAASTTSASAAKSSFTPSTSLPSAPNSSKAGFAPSATALPTVPSSGASSVGALLPSSESKKSTTIKRRPSQYEEVVVGVPSLRDIGESDSDGGSDASQDSDDEDEDLIAWRQSRQEFRQGTIKRTSRLTLTDAAPAKIDYRDEIWYHGLQTRELCEQTLSDPVTRKALPDGSFVVRESTNIPGQFVVSMTLKGCFYHNRVTEASGRFSTNSGRTHGSLAELLEYHKAYRDSFLTLLTTPVPNPANVRKRAASASASSADAAGASNPNKSGWMSKQRGARAGSQADAANAVKPWKIRYFVLQPGALTYFQKPAALGEAGIGSIQLTSDTRCRPLGKNVFGVETPRRMYSLKCHDDEVVPGTFLVFFLRISECHQKRSAPSRSV
eukprot:m.837925 g.837925  ORF g.837925 m.837925 type:complete len:745 (+) comp59493_c0_seq1:118-2352(+)